MTNVLNWSVSLVLTAIISAPALAAQVANYDFQNSLASTGPSAPSLVDLGTGSFVDDSVSGQACRVFQFAEQTGFSLDITGLIGGTNYTFVAMMNLAEVDSYSKILDIHNRVLDEGLYAYDFDLLFYDYSDFDLDQLNDNTWAQIALTFDGSTLRGYVDGVAAFSEADTDTVGAITSNTLYFFRDDNDTSDSENSSGRVANIQLYDQALSAGSIAALSFSCGNNASGSVSVSATQVPTMSGYALLSTVLLLLLVATYRFRESERTG